MLKGSAAVFLFVTGIFLLGILAGHWYSRRIVDELKKPKTLLGKLLLALGSLGGGWPDFFPTGFRNMYRAWPLLPFSAPVSCWFLSLFMPVPGRAGRKKDEKRFRHFD